jgi:glucokinase
MSGIIAVDIGGTQIRAAVYPQQGITPTRVRRIATVSGEGSVFDRMAALIESVRLEETVEAVSVATAGQMDLQTGVIVNSPNIPGWDHFPLRSRLEEKFAVPVFIGNDANLAALGEWKYGAGQGHNDLLYLTISTGIGGGVISRGCLLEGAHGMAAELGHVIVLPDGPLCSCGVRGHLEAIASGPSIARCVSEEIASGRASRLAKVTDFSARDVAEAARLGDELANEAFQRAGKYLGQAVADFLHIFNPSIVIFGGGVSLSGALLLDPVRASMQRLVMTPDYLDGLQIVLAQLGDDAGLLGALAQARLKLSELSPTG